MTWDGEWEQERESASLGASLWGRGGAQGWALSFILMPYPSSLSLSLGQSQVNTFCFSGKRI